MFIATIKEALNLIISFNPELWKIVGVSLEIASIAIVIAGLFSIPLAVAIDLLPTRFKKVITTILNSLLAMPTVAIALFVYMFICRSGILGKYHLLFTPAAIVIGQIILATPIITTIILSGLKTNDKLLYETLITLGAGKIAMIKAIIIENSSLVTAAVMLGFGRVISEIGIAMMLGGNVRFYTRTLTTALALETSQGEFEQAIALGIILVLLALIINSFSMIFKK